MANGVMFAELHVVSGERQESSDLVGIATAPVLLLFKRRRGQLFSVTDPSRPGSEAMCRRLTEIIEDEYFRDPSRSITRSLQAAIIVANEALRAENARVAPDKQLHVGLCCAAVRDGDIFIAQVSPATAFILHNGVVTRVFSSYGLVSETSGNGNGHASDSLGARLDPHINFGFSPLAEGDLVVLASGANWKMIPDRYIVDAARQIDPEMAALELYGSYTAHTRRPTTSMVVIQVADILVRPRGRENDQRVRVAGGKREAKAKAVKAKASSNEKKELLPAGVIEAVELETERPWSGGKSRTGRAVLPKPRRGASPEPEEPRSSRYGGSSRQRSFEKDEIRKPRSSTGLSLWDRIKLSLGRGQKKAPQLPGPSVSAVRKPEVRLRKPPQMRSERRRPGLAMQVVMIVVLAAVFVVAGNAAIGFWKMWQIGDPVALIQQAQEKQAAAAAADTPASKRVYLVQSVDLLNRSLQAREDQSVRSVATSLQTSIDKIDGVVRIDKADIVVDYSSIAQDKGEVTQLMLDGSSLYVLDGGLGRVFRYTLTSDGRGVQEQDKHPVLVKKGDRVDGKVTGDLLAMTWMPAGQLRTQPSLFVLEGGRSIVSYDEKSSLTRVDVSENQRWGTIRAIDGFAGGLYMLDTKQRSLYYYPPTKNGYESQAYVIIDANARVDLTKAVDMALDGNLYLLQGDGTILRFTREGRVLDFVGDLPDGKIADPKALFASAATRSVYALDAAAERIVQYSPEGKFQRQFKADGKNVSFKDVRDLFVDEANRRAYVLTRKSLLVFDLPPLQ